MGLPRFLHQPSHCLFRMSLDRIRQVFKKKSPQARCYELLYTRGDLGNRLIRRRFKLFRNSGSDEKSSSASDSSESSTSNDFPSSSTCSSAELGPLTIFFANDVGNMLDDYGRVLKKLSSTITNCNLEALVNRVATTGRYQEKVKLGCIFGCSNGQKRHRDPLRHYLAGPLLLPVANSLLL